MVKSKINVDADKRFHLRITQWSYPICDSWTSTSIRHWLLASQPTSKEYCTVCLWEIFNIILYFPVDCLFRVKTITLETANITNCHVIATDILFLSSNHRSVQFLYLAASNDRSQGKRIPCDFLNNFSSVDLCYEEKSWNKTPCKKMLGLYSAERLTATKQYADVPFVTFSWQFCFKTKPGRLIEDFWTPGTYFISREASLEL